MGNETTARTLTDFQNQKKARKTFVLRAFEIWLPAYPSICFW